MTDQPTRGARTAAEWTALACSCLVLAVLMGLIAVRLGDDREPASPFAVVDGEVRSIGGLHHLYVVVTNRGDDTAANVQVSAELTIDGDVTTADQTIDFLAGDEEEGLVFVFADDPADGELTVAVTSFAEP